MCVCVHSNVCWFDEQQQQVQLIYTRPCYLISLQCCMYIIKTWFAFCLCLPSFWLTYDETVSGIPSVQCVVSFSQGKQQQAEMSAILCHLLYIMCPLLMQQQQQHKHQQTHDAHLVIVVCYSCWWWLNNMQVYHKKHSFQTSVQSLSAHLTRDAPPLLLHLFFVVEKDVV